MYINELDFWPGEPTSGGSADGVAMVLGPADIDSSGVRAGTATRTWGSGPVGIDNALLPLPTALAVNYASVVEQRSYGGRVPLPRARLDSVLAHLAAHPELYQSMYTYPENESGFELQAGLGPGSLVVVWLLGEQYQVEIARVYLPVVDTIWPKPAGVNPNAPFTSTETEPAPPARRFAELRRQVGRAELAHMDSFPHTLPALLDSLGQRYCYRLRVLGQPLTPTTLDATFLDGEREPLPAPGGDAGRLTRAVPNGLQYTVADPALRTRQCSTVFEPTETRRAFAWVRATCAPDEVPELRCRRLTVALPRAVTYVGSN